MLALHLGRNLLSGVQVRGIGRYLEADSLGSYCISWDRLLLDMLARLLDLIRFLLHRMVDWRLCLIMEPLWYVLDLWFPVSYC